MYFYSINCAQVVKTSSPFVSRIFSFSRSDTVTINRSSPSIPGYLILLGICLIWISPTGGVIEHFSFCVGLFHFTWLEGSFTLEHVWQLSCFWRLNHIPLCLYYTVLIHLSVECLCCFHLLGTVNNASMNMGYKYLSQFLVLNILGVFPGLKLMDSMLTLCLFLRSPLLFSAAAALFHYMAYITVCLYMAE